MSQLDGRQRFEATIAAIDAANADDPATLLVDGIALPKELTHAEMMSRWVRVLEPDASEELLLAARRAPRAALDDSALGPSRLGAAGICAGGARCIRSTRSWRRRSWKTMATGARPSSGSSR